MKRLHWVLLPAALTLAIAVSASASPDKLGRSLADRLDTQRLASTNATVGEATFAVWVRFTDKGVAGSARDEALREAGAALSDRARTRRELRSGIGETVDEADLPVAAAYLDGVLGTGMQPRRQSRWLNAASFEATAAQIEAAARLPYVAGIDLVRQSGKSTVSDLQPVADLQRSPDKNGGTFAYGPSLNQLDAINVPPAHDQGLTGNGIVIAIFDTGFDVDHEAFDAADIVATWNFISEQAYVGAVEGEDRFQVLHGTAALSLMAANTPGVLVGSAPGASYLLAKTEDVSSETPAEEDNWIAALEWAEGLGADVVSSGVGYYYWYDYSDLDGVSTAITTAAELAAARGVCVVNSVGNERNNPEWPHLIPPADGRHVIAVGAVSPEGLLASFSSPGPTADGRRKPDVMGQGVNLLAALGGTGYLYGTGTGVDYAVSVVAGSVALMLEHSPWLTPGQVMTALHATASRAQAPDNDYGWGIANTMAAINHGLPVITHTQMGDREAAAGGYEVNAGITSVSGLAPGGSLVVWRRDAQAWQLLTLQAQGGDAFRAVIPAQAGSGAIQYYFIVEETYGRTAVQPLQGENAPYEFRFGVDAQAPTLAHTSLSDQVPANWPPLLVVEASDNVGIASVSVETTVNGVPAGSSALSLVGDHFELPFPVAAGSAPVGAELGYRFTVSDLAVTPNIMTSADYSFRVVASRGNVLLVDERAASKSATPSGRQNPPEADADKSITDIQGWLTDAGFEVETITGGSVQAADFIGRDLVVVTCGVSTSPLANLELRDGLVNYVREGGRILSEGGELGYVCWEQPYPTIAEYVLHVNGYFGEESPALWPAISEAGHPFLNRPNGIDASMPIADTGNWYGAADVMRPALDATIVMHPQAGSGAGGIIVHDDNSCPEAGQTVYFTFDLGRMSIADGRTLVQNAATWLTYREPAGPSTITGRLFLQGSMDFTGATVRTRSGHTGVIDAGGHYTISGLWGGHHVITATATGYSTMTLEANLADGEQAALNFTLMPVVTTSGSATPNLAIPDNNVNGLSIVIPITTGVTVQGVEVDVDIAHFSIGQLVVELVAPNGTTVTLHNRTGGVGDNIVGTWPVTLVVDGPGALGQLTGLDPRGDWTLKISDRVFGATGSLRSWGLRLLVTEESAADAGTDVPLATRLAGNVPNPFNPSTTVAFSLGRPGVVRLEIFDARGRLVRRLTNDVYEAGRHELVWNGTDDAGAPVASGVYFALLDADDTTDVNKMMLLK
jgi:subtilisin-like proprotein convertase family protein